VLSVYIENFKTIFSTKDNIKTLRNKVLELAVQGKLVEQGKNDESALELVKMIEIERDKLLKEGKIKKKKTRATINKDEIPFDIPEGWEWVRFDDVAFFKKGPFGSSITKSMFIPRDTNTYKVYEQKNAIQKDNTLGEYYITEEKFNELRNFEVFPGDIIVSCAGTIGETYILPPEIEPGIINQALMKIELSNLIEKDFFLMFFDTVLNSYITGKSKGSAIKNIPPLDVLKNIPFAVPSHKEQILIIDKYKSLMSEIDKLEESLQKKEHLMELLPKAVVDAISKCQTGEQLKEQLYFIVENFDIVFQMPESLQELRNVVLQLAIEGKLVPQDTADEPASELLNKIKTEKDNLVNEGKIKEEKTLPRIEDEEKVFDIPNTWKWCRVGSILELLTDYHANGGYETLKANVELLDNEDYAIMVRITNLGENPKEDYKYISKQAYNFLSKSKLYKDDLVMSKITDPGTVYLVPEMNKPMSLAMNLFLLRISKRINSKYIYLYLKARKTYVQSFQGGTSTKTITKDAVKALVLALPPINEQHRIVQKAESIMSLINQMENKVKRKYKLLEKMVSL